MTLTKDEVQELKNYANEMPTKYGAALLAWLMQKEQKQTEVKDEDGK